MADHDQVYDNIVRTLEKDTNPQFQGVVECYGDKELDKAIESLEIENIETEIHMDFWNGDSDVTSSQSSQDTLCADDDNDVEKRDRSTISDDDDIMVIDSSRSSKRNKTSDVVENDKNDESDENPQSVESEMSDGDFSFSDNPLSNDTFNTDTTPVTPYSVTSDTTPHTPYTPYRPTTPYTPGYEETSSPATVPRTPECPMLLDDGKFRDITRNPYPHKRELFHRDEDSIVMHTPSIRDCGLVPERLPTYPPNFGLDHNNYPPETPTHDLNHTSLTSNLTNTMLGIPRTYLPQNEHSFTYTLSSPVAYTSSHLHTLANQARSTGHVTSELHSPANQTLNTDHMTSDLHSPTNQTLNTDHTTSHNIALQSSCKQHQLPSTDSTPTLQQTKYPSIMPATYCNSTPRSTTSCRNEQHTVEAPTHTDSTTRHPVTCSTPTPTPSPVQHHVDNVMRQCEVTSSSSPYVKSLLRDKLEIRRLERGLPVRPEEVVAPVQEQLSPEDEVRRGEKRKRNAESALKYRTKRQDRMEHLLQTEQQLLVANEALRDKERRLKEAINDMRSRLLSEGWLSMRS